MFTEVEIAKLKKSVPEKDIEDTIIAALESKEFHRNTLINIPSQKYQYLNKFSAYIYSITICDIAENFDKSNFKCYYYEFSEHENPENEILEGSDENNVTGSLHWMLPNKNELNGLWETLIYDGRLKENLLDFAKTIILFSSMEVNQNIICCNRLILLHGPPGGGKTSLAKALAQKLSIQMNHKYQFTHLFEINSHSLFSRWFSESARLVQRIFDSIQEIVEMKESLVIVLIDEVESVAYNRGNISSNEPSDALRVVNSILTQLDKIKKYPNVLVITTSNLTKTIDLAFLDRADIVTFIDQPSIDAIFKIFSSVFVELAAKGLIVPDSEDDGRDEFNIATIENYETFHELQQHEQQPFSTANIMTQICKEALNLSGRALRKLPFLAHALFLKKDSATLREFLISMRYAINYSKSNKEIIDQSDEVK